MISKHANDNEDRLTAVDLQHSLDGLTAAERARILAAAEAIRARRRGRPMRPPGA